MTSKPEKDGGVAKVAHELQLSEAQFIFLKNLAEDAFVDWLMEDPEAKFTSEMEQLLAKLGLEESIAAYKKGAPPGWDRRLEKGGDR